MGKKFDFVTIRQNDSKYCGLHVTGNTTGSSLAYFKQEGTNNAALFEGGGGVDIKGVRGKKNALNIYENQTEYPATAIVNNGAGDALFVKQQGSGRIANFTATGDGEGVTIKGIKGNKNALEIYSQSDTAACAFIKNNGSGAALSVLQEGSGHIAWFHSKTRKAKFIIDQEKSDLESISLAIYQAEKPVWKPTNNLSDLTLAENVTPIENALDKVLSLEGVSFSWQDKALGEGKEIGISAQKVAEVLPELVHSGDGESGLVKYEKLVPVLIEAIKTQQKQIEQLQKGVQLFGAVAKDGTPTIPGSSDWASHKLETGVYEIKFATPFQAPPVVIVNGYIPREEGGASSDNTFSVGPITEQSVTIRSFDVESRVTDNAGKLQDAPFTFMAIASR